MSDVLSTMHERPLAEARATAAKKRAKAASAYELFLEEYKKELRADGEDLRSALFSRAGKARCRRAWDTLPPEEQYSFTLKARKLRDDLHAELRRQSLAADLNAQPAQRLAIADSAETLPVRAFAVPQDGTISTAVMTVSGSTSSKPSYRCENPTGHTSGRLDIPIWISIYEFPYIDIRIWVSIYVYPYIDIHRWLSIYGYPYMDTRRWISINGCPYMDIYI